MTGNGEIVTLRNAIIRDGYEFPAGSRGACVFVYRAGVAFEVEFTDPVHCVATVDREDLVLPQPDPTPTPSSEPV